MYRTFTDFPPGFNPFVRDEAWPLFSPPFTYFSLCTPSLFCSTLCFFPFSPPRKLPFRWRVSCRLVELWPFSPFLTPLAPLLSPFKLNPPVEVPCGPLHGNNVHPNAKDGVQCEDFPPLFLCTNQIYFAPTSPDGRSTTVGFPPSALHVWGEYFFPTSPLFSQAPPPRCFLPRPSYCLFPLGMTGPTNGMPQLSFLSSITPVLF